MSYFSKGEKTDFFGLKIPKLENPPTMFCCEAEELRPDIFLLCGSQSS